MKQTTSRRNTGVLAAILLGFFALLGGGLPATGVGTGSVSGTVSFSEGDSIYLALRTTDDIFVAGQILPADGTYSFTDLEDGDYLLVTNSTGASLQTFYPGTTERTTATTVTVSGGPVADIDFAVVKAASISGTVTAPASEAWIGLQVYDAAGVEVRSVGLDISTGIGTYEVNGLAAGTYKVAFERASKTATLAAEFYDDVPDSAGIGAATPLVLTVGQALAGIDAELVTGGTATGKVVDEAGQPIGGARLYAIPDGDSPATRQATTEPDGTFTIRGLSTQDYIVKVIANLHGELFYGNVRDIADATAVGMTIGENVDLGVLSYATGPTVDRWDGLDRYEVSANISEMNFPSGAHTVFVANGLASADALAADPVARVIESPILLVKKDGIPATVAAELDRLNPTDIVILGGEGSVSAVVETKLESYASRNVYRFGGADRYEVSANIAEEVSWSSEPVVYVANGLASADALAAGPVAEGPILLVKRDGIPASVASVLASLDPSRVVILGGEGSVSATVEDKLATYSDDVVRWDGADRYVVSANISNVNFPGGAGTVFVANGLASADALAAGPVAAMIEGPILLVKKDGIPTSVADEIERLTPARIVILGGTGSVSEIVEDRLEAIW